MCSYRSGSVLDVEACLCDLVAHFFVDFFEKRGVGITCDVSVIECGHIITLQKSLHAVKIHCAHVFEIIFCSFNWFLTLVEVISGAARDYQNKDDQKDDQSFFLLFLSDWNFLHFLILIKFLIVCIHISSL